MSSDEFDPDEGHPFIEEVEELRQEHISEFRGELLQSYYRSKEDCAVLAFDAYGEAARHMSVGDWRAAVVLGSAAIEACLRDAILRPIVCGLVHNAELATIVAQHALSHASFDRVQNLVFELLKTHGNVDLGTYAREGTTKTLWREITEVRGVRNRIMHGAEGRSGQRLTRRSGGEPRPAQAAPSSPARARLHARLQREARRLRTVSRRHVGPAPPYWKRHSG